MVNSQNDNIPELFKLIFDNVWNAFGYARSYNYDENGNHWPGDEGFFKVSDLMRFALSWNPLYEKISTCFTRSSGRSNLSLSSFIIFFRQRKPIISTSFRRESIVSFPLFINLFSSPSP